jgi:uncharacterized protein YndB with AHSA1/START domain
VPAPFAFDRTWTFAVPAEVLWRTITRTDDFPRWWSWLHELDADGVRPGATARCVVQAPLPYALRFDVRVLETVEARLVDTEVTGDLHGSARLEITPRDAGASDARLMWSLEMRNPVLRGLAVVGRPAMVWAHDRVVELGVAQFERRALDDRTG